MTEHLPESVRIEYDHWRRAKSWVESLVLEQFSSLEKAKSFAESIWRDKLGEEILSIVVAKVEEKWSTRNG